MRTKNLYKITALLAALILSACGGGDDGNGTGSPPDTSNPPVVAPNTAPVAKGGADQNVVTGATVTLDGTASSDADSDSLTYAWTMTSKPAGSAATLSSGNVVRPTFVADVAGVYTASLIVNDGKVDSDAVSVTITATTANAAPVASAGANQEAATGASVSLNGSASSDANGDPLTYKWVLTSVPAGSTAALQSADTAQPSFIPDLEGQYVASLIVNDGQVDSAPSTVTVSATRANAAPTANAGTNQSVRAQTSVTLDGSASSDSNGDPLTYRWTLTSKPEGSAASLSSSTAVHPTFVADKDGDYVASLVVNDGRVDSEPVTVTITVSTPSLSLYSIRENWFGEASESLVSLPYASSGAHSATIMCVGSGCETTYSVGKFKLVAAGQNYTITNLVAENLSGSAIQPLFTGLANNQVITAGQSVVFELRSPFTGGRTVNLRYRFTIKETGETFNATVTLQTN